MFLMNIFIMTALGFAYLAYKGAAIARILLYFCNSVGGSLGHHIIYLHAQITSVFCNGGHGLNYCYKKIV